MSSGRQGAGVGEISKRTKGRGLLPALSFVS
jgi:hypothetical protein